MEQSIYDALMAEQWYPLAALLLFGLVAFLKNAPLGKEAWAWLDAHRARWVAPVVIAFATGFSGAFFESAPWGVALLKGLSAVLYIGLGSMGLHSALRDSPAPYEGSVTNGEET